MLAAYSPATVERQILVAWKDVGRHDVVEQLCSSAVCTWCFLAHGAAVAAVLRTVSVLWDGSL